MKKLLIPAILLTALAVLSFKPTDEDSIADRHRCELIDSNAEAFYGVREIDGHLVIVDSIPCWSFAQVRNTFFTRIKGEYYIDCSTCAKSQGRPTGKPSSCTSVREMNVNNPQ